MEDWFNALWRYTRDLMGKVLGTPGCAGRLSGHGWKLMCEAVVGFGNPAVTNDREPLYPKDGPFAPGGGDVVELVAGGTVMYPDPLSGSGKACAEVTKYVRWALSLGTITCVGTVRENGMAAMWSDSPNGLSVGSSVSELQVRARVRYVNADGVKAHLAM